MILKWRDTNSMDAIYEISDLEKLVKAGAELLDERKPGWYQIFDDELLSYLNMGDELTCVLGFVFGSWWNAVDFFFPDFESPEKEAQKFGFDLDTEFVRQYNPDSDAWADLLSLWYEIIVDRQENGVPSE